MLLTGLDCILAEPIAELNTARLGLLFNQASVTADGQYAADALANCYAVQNLTCLFSPQHGVWGEEQANMIETGHSYYSLASGGQEFRCPLYSLYSETRAPTSEMLDQIDVLLIDLQDVGTRVYTFIWTMLNCLEACARAARHVIVLDRPNPLGGVAYEGQLLQDDYRSFVGLDALPMRHGLTIGECARWLVNKRGIDVQLSIVPMRQWKRSQRFPECNRHWVCPSPNMPTYRTTCVYPGGVLLEGTNLSEGRGTTIPFEVVGAPFIDQRELASELNSRDLPGVRFRPTRFRPTFDKWKGESCRGVYFDVVDDSLYQSYRTMLHVLHAVRGLYGSQLQWLSPPYEYERTKLPIDILVGSDQVRLAADHQVTRAELDALAVTEPSWQRDSCDYWLYD